MPAHRWFSSRPLRHTTEVVRSYVVGALSRFRGSGTVDLRRAAVRGVVQRLRDATLAFEAFEDDVDAAGVLVPPEHITYLGTAEPIRIRAEGIEKLVDVGVASEVTKDVFC